MWCFGQIGHHRIAGNVLAERQREFLNTLYVAITRAKQCLVLSCVQSKNANPGSWWERLAPLMQQDVQPQDAVAAASADAAFTLLELPALPPMAGGEGAQPSPATAADPDSLSARQGQAMHALLEQVGGAGVPLAQARSSGWDARRLARLARWPVEHGEGLQVLRYQRGNEYQPHYDYFDPSQPGTPHLLRRGGQRVATFVIYLNTPEQGGATTFPDVGLDIAPRQGHAVFFSYPRPHPSTRSLHGGAPVRAGEKWIATNWLRERPFD